MKTLSKIEETSYLTNKMEYRYIMRCFYNEYEKVHFQLYKEELMELLKEKYPEVFADYDLDLLRLDLDSLVGWKNLTPFQDPKKVYTIEDYKNKQYRYSMTEAAVEIEKMAVKLENLFLEPASLSSNYFKRLEFDLQKTETLDPADYKTVQDWWNDLQEDFLRLNQNYKDYLREFYSGRSDKILKSVEFIMHKDRFLDYLKEFIIELTNYSEKIAIIIQDFNPDFIEKLLSSVIAAEQNTPRPKSELSSDYPKYLSEMIHGKWKALCDWFIRSESGISESERILDITNEIIQKIVQNAALIVQLENWGISRKADYKHYIDMFLDCTDMAEANKLSAHVFGVQSIKHFTTEQVRETDSINSSVFEEDAFEMILTPHTRKYTPRVDNKGYEGRRLEKENQKQEYLKRTESERKMVMKYIKDRKLSVSDIHEVVSESTRTIILSWISLANGNKSKTAHTEYGQSFRLSRQDGSCVLRCEDGDVEMPRFVLEFEE